MSTCKSCGAAIVWATSAKSRQRMPLDAEPAADGNIYINLDDQYEVLSKADVEAIHARDDLSGRHTRLYKSHFSTCVFAAAHRKGK